MKYNFRELAERWPSAIVARHEVERFTGGLISGRSMANLDCLGEGPPRSKMGRKVFYRVEDLVRWLQARAEASE